ncbi:MAG: hydroxymethylglutaryl-CoA synthase [Candidatus Aminicenantes bacterium]|nr:hydroxymethylglutaryl-CoA synthase [Candidatus Aminicenantes bacterium]MDH5704896.1 hydroxymethylglutaryl-CoA synthase [Candidatus Aminicenantes bacterium]
MKQIGIEKINIYGCSLYMSQNDLAIARNKDPEKVVKDYLIDSRSLNPAYEDMVTMGVNAAHPILSEQDKEEIGLFVVGTEGSLDFGKPITTNIHEALGLPPNVRNFEIKHACYSGAAALDTAINWIASGLNDNKKALIIASDFSRKHFNKDHEFVLGGVAAALIISDTPEVIEYELGKKGCWTTNVYDTFRPTAFAEVGNNEVSLYSYLDALEGSYLDYVKNTGKIDFDSYFRSNIYHTPFPGMAFQAHRVLCNLSRPRKKSEIIESFQEKNLPSLRYAQRVGSTYSASNFVCLCGLIKSDNNLKAGDRVGFFSYGSGAIGEFYSGIILPQAREIIDSMKIDEALDARRRVSVEEYEEIETIRERYTENPNFTPDFSVLDNWYDKHYRGNKLLVLKEVKDYIRKYDWS